jgi:hypothetical protein
MGFDIEKVKIFASAYNAAGKGQTSNGLFLTSLVESCSPPRGRGKEWLKDIFSKGIPDPMNEDVLRRVEEIEKCAAQTQKPDDAETLRDFSRKISQGRTLTERQVSFLESLMERSKIEIVYIDITPDINGFICLLRNKILHGTTSYYWNERPGTYNRATKIMNFFEKTGKIDTDDFNFLRSIFKGFTEEWENADSFAGKIMYSRAGEPVLVLNKRLDSVGIYQVSVDVLIDGKSKVFPLSSLLKRKPKQKSS